MLIEMLDYSVTVPSINGSETANFFGEHPIYGTVGYPSYEDAENDLHGILGFGQFLDCVESCIANGLIGDHYVFDPQNMIVEIVNEYEGWDWTPETGIIPWESEVKPELGVCLNHKRRRMGFSRHRFSSTICALNLRGAKRVTSGAILTDLRDEFPASSLSTSTKIQNQFLNRNRLMSDSMGLWKSAKELPSQWNGTFLKQFRENLFNSP